MFCFLPIVLATFHFLIRREQLDLAKMWLIASSIIFYGNFIPVHLLLLAFSTVANFSLGRILLTSTRKAAKVVLVLGLILNLSILTAFKYTDFFIRNLNALFNADLPTFGLVLPLALSFFSFQKIAYLIDVYKGGAPRYSFRDFALFVVFFPQLIAGPIVHHRAIMPQIAKLGRGRDAILDVAVGATAFIVGLFKKMGIADSLSIYSDMTFGGASRGLTPDLVTAWMGVVSFALQIYFDFSGYSDMALGLGRMFGIKLPVNFLSPYKATSIIEFWRRWHITLSEFLKNYLYIPLGGNRRGPLRRYANMWIVMLLGGLWHGANWTFVIWGGLHGLYLSVNHAFQTLQPSATGGRAGKVLAWTSTMLAVLVAWVFFRAPDFPTAFRMLSGMIGGGGIILPSAAKPFFAFVSPLENFLNISFGGMAYLAAAPANLVWIPVALVICLFAPNVADWLSQWELALRYRSEPVSALRQIEWAPTVPWGIALGFLLAFCVTYQQNTTQFLYFQF